eukprot:290734-Hanusia_phi.AAC.1
MNPDFRVNLGSARSTPGPRLQVPAVPYGPIRSPVSQLSDSDTGLIPYGTVPYGPGLRRGLDKPQSLSWSFAGPRAHQPLSLRLPGIRVPPTPTVRRRCYTLTHLARPTVLR